MVTVDRRTLLLSSWCNHSIVADVWGGHFFFLGGGYSRFHTVMATRDVTHFVALHPPFFCAGIKKKKKERKKVRNNKGKLTRFMKRRSWSVTLSIF